MNDILHGDKVGMGRHHEHREQQVQVHRGTKQTGMLEEQPDVQSVLRKHGRCGWTASWAQIIKSFEYHDKKLRPFPVSNGELLKYFK